MCVTEAYQLGWIRVTAEYLENALSQNQSWDLTAVQEQSVTPAEASLFELVHSVRQTMDPDLDKLVGRFCNCEF